MKQIQKERHLSLLLVLLNLDGLETLGVLDVDGLDVAVKALLGTLLVVTATRDADAEAERNTADTVLPDLGVEQGVKADILGSLCDGRRKRATRLVSDIHCRHIASGNCNQNNVTYHGLLGELADLLDSPGSSLLEAHTMNLNGLFRMTQYSQSSVLCPEKRCDLDHATQEEKAFGISSKVLAGRLEYYSLSRLTAKPGVRSVNHHMVRRKHSKRQPSTCEMQPNPFKPLFSWTMNGLHQTNNRKVCVCVFL